MSNVIELETASENTYMTPDHLEYFRQKLLNWQDELVAASKAIMINLKEHEGQKPDPIDFGTMQAEKELNLITENRNNHLIRQIEYALYRIKQGEYGYCEITGEEIGIERLKIMPLTSLSVEAQERMEKYGS